jgi:hypothetical protein
LRVKGTARVKKAWALHGRAHGAGLVILTTALGFKMQYVDRMLIRRPLKRARRFKLDEFARAHFVPAFAFEVERVFDAMLDNKVLKKSGKTAPPKCFLLFADGREILEHFGVCI